MPHIGLIEVQCWIFCFASHILFQQNCSNKNENILAVLEKFLQWKLCIIPYCLPFCITSKWTDSMINAKATDHNFVRKFYLKIVVRTCTYTQNNVNFREISTL